MAVGLARVRRAGGMESGNSRLDDAAWVDVEALTLAASNRKNLDLANSIESRLTRGNTSSKFMSIASPSSSTRCVRAVSSSPAIFSPNWG